MATLEQLRRTVGRKTGMTYDSAGTDRDLIDSWCNEGVREVLLRSHCHTAASILTTTANQWQYDLSTNIMAIPLIWRDGETSPMVRVSPEQIIEFRRANGSTTDATTLYWSLHGANMLMLYPTPTSAYDINIVYVPRPTEMSTTSHDPSNAVYGGVPVEYHKAIELWALANASDHEHEQGTQRGLNYMAQFDEYMKRVRAGINRKGGALPPARRGRRHRNIPTSNGRYP